jgi:hypothetical protein
VFGAPGCRTLRIPSRTHRPLAIFGQGPMIDCERFIAEHKLSALIRAENCTT